MSNFLLLYYPQDDYAVWLSKQLVAQGHHVTKKTIEEWDSGAFGIDELGGKTLDAIVINARFPNGNCDTRVIQEVAREVAKHYQGDYSKIKLVVYDEYYNDRLITEFEKAIKPCNTNLYFLYPQKNIRWVLDRLGM